jgi:hypothetical protein
MSFQVRDTAICTQTTRHTRKRPGHGHPPGFTGGNLGGVCVPSALWRPEAHVSDPHPSLESDASKP